MAKNKKGEINARNIYLIVSSKRKNFFGSTERGYFQKIEERCCEFNLL